MRLVVDTKIETAVVGEFSNVEVDLFCVGIRPESSIVVQDLVGFPLVDDRSEIIKGFVEIIENERG